MLKVLLVVFVIGSVVVSLGAKGNFQSGGANVCERNVKETKSYKVSSVTHFPVSRKTKCGVFGWWRCKEQRTATKTVYLIETKLVDVTVLYCCDGWRESAVSGINVCNIPYCRLGCQNGGTCIGGQHRCSCPKAWTGDHCDLDVNECHKSNGNCQQVCTNTPGSFACGCFKGYIVDMTDKRRCHDLNECTHPSIMVQCRCANQKSLDCGAICQNTIGSYRCACSKGYRLVGRSICEDIDECLSPKTNTCPFKCYNRPGSYGCDCIRGFRLGSDGTTCEDINECDINNGACQHKCLNAYGTYVCQCRLGFKLHRNRKRCVDVDECQSFHGCEMRCNNTFGSYFCSCPNGYELNADGFTCSDIDECSIRKVKGLVGNTSLSDCEQLCINTVGSFKCSCTRGFLLRSDGKSCKDSDECSSGTHQCGHKCQNIFGSYVCSCRPGYILNPDKKACRPVTCESIESPFHGDMNCSGLSTGGDCLFKCDLGYQLFGSKMRTCLPSSKWSGTITTCRAKSCPELQAPENTAVLLPCYKTFRSKCSMECAQDYYSKGDGVATCEVDNSGALEWSVKQFECEKIKVCQPNPCLNNGKCLIQQTRFVCDCRGTGFEGRICQTGVITMPVFERLKANEESKPFYLYAQPKNELRVTIRSTQSILIKPRNELRISKLSQKVQFRIVPLRQGLHVISYSLSGEDAKNFKVPENNTVYVEPKGKMDSVYNTLQIAEGTLPVGCHEYKLPEKLLQCRAYLISTHPWVRRTSNYLKSSCEGIVHLKVNSITLPISLFGTSSMTLSPTKEELLHKIQKMSSKSMKSSISISRNGRCEVLPMQSGYLLEFIQTDALPRTILNSFSKLMPKWIQINIDRSNDLFDVSNLLVSVGKPLSYGPGSCEHLPLPSLGSVFFKPAIAFQTRIDGETKKFGSNEQVCFAMDVCENKAFLDFSPKARKSFQQMTILRNLKNAGWDFHVSSLGLKRKTLADKNDFDIWMKGKAEVHLTDPRLSVRLNMSGEIATNSECFEELFSRQFMCPISGEIKGKMSIRTTMQLKNSEKILLMFKSDTSSGTFQFGGDDGANLKKLLPLECGTLQGAHITLRAKENPFQGSVLSYFVLPYLQHSMNVSIYHSIDGGGQTGVRMPAVLQMKFMILGFVAKQFKVTLQSVPLAVPQLQPEGSHLLKMATELNTLVTKSSQVVNANMQSTLHGEEAQRFTKAIASLENQMTSVLKLSLSLSKKLLQYKSNSQVPLLIAGIKSFTDNIQTVKSLTLDVERSPVKQNLKGLVVGTMAQVCVGQLCIPDVKASVVAFDDDIVNSANPKCVLSDRQDNPAQPFPLITVSPSKSMKLGNILFAEKDQSMRLNFAQQLLQLNSIITMFGISKQAKLNITNRQLHANIKGNIFNQFQCHINLTADTNVDGWGSLVFKARGTMDSNSTLTRLFEKELNRYAIAMVERSEKRVQNAKSGLENATMKTQSAQKLLSLTRIGLDNLEKNQMFLKKLLHRKKASYSKVIAWFDDALHNYNITSFARKSCTLTECEKICNKTCVQDICWDKTNVEYNKGDCRYVDSAISKLMPDIETKTITYTTIPQIRTDVGKCKHFATALVENVLTLGLSSLFKGKRRKRSLTQDENRSSDKPLQVLNVNEYFRASNLTLSPDFDISIELRKRIPKLPTHFDLNKALNSYILKQHRFDVNEILKEQFPALSSNFNINKELLMAVPELKRTFLFDEFLKKIVRNSVRLNSPINLKKDLGNLLPQLSSDFDSVLKRSLPQLRSLDSITTLIQAYLDDVVQFTLDQEKLKKFDINDIIKTRFRGLRRDVDINALLLQQIPQLDPKFNINKLIRNAVLGIGPQVDRLDELIAKTSGLPDFSLQKTLSKSFPGFDQRINFDELIKNEMKNMMSVKINDLKIKTLTFTNIIKSTIPKFNESNIDNILTTAFPSLEKKFNFREILKGAIPLIKALGDLDLNNLIKAVFKSTGHLDLDLDQVLKRRNPALRGEINIERYLSKRFRDVALPNFSTIIKTPGSRKINIESILEEVVGSNGIDILRNVIKNGVFSDEQDVVLSAFDDGANHKIHRNRVRRFIIPLVGALIFKSVIDAKKNSGCTHIYRTTIDAAQKETHQYTQISAVLNKKIIPIKKWLCTGKLRKVNLTSEGYRPRTCCRADIPCVKFLNPVCVTRNENCFKERQHDFKRYQSSFNVSLFDQYRKLVTTEQEVADVALKLEEVRLRKQVALQNFHIIQARVNQLCALRNTSEIVYHKIKSIPQVHLGFKVQRILRESFDDRPLRVTDLSFNTISSTLSKYRLPFQATVNTKRGNKLVFDFIVDFEKVNSSLKYATQEAIRLLTSSSRKRRSVDNDLSSPIQTPEYDSCLLAKNASLYFSDILASLRLMLDSNDEQKSQLSRELDVLDDLGSTLDRNSQDRSEHSVIKGYIHVLSIYKEERREQAEMMSWNETVVAWKNYVENVTDIRQLPNCSGAFDCVEELQERLSEYYNAFGNTSEEAVNIVRTLKKLSLGIKELLAVELSEDQVKSRLQSLFFMLNKTKDKTILCGDKPQMLTNADKELRPLVGEDITLHCYASSQSEILYTWRRDNVLVQRSKDGTLDLRDLKEADQGRYRCEPRNHKGSVFSEITTIIVEVRPQIMEHPEASQVPLNSESTASLSCVASGKPIPTITWLYRPPSSNISIVLPNEDSNILTVIPDDTEKGGYYYCEATNSRGVAVSRQARIDILAVTATNPKMAIVFNVTISCKARGCRKQQNIPSRLDDTLKNSIRTMIRKSMGLPSRSISRLRYLPGSKSIAQLILFISTPLRNVRKDLSNPQTMERFAEARSNLVGKLKRLVHAMNKTILLTSNPATRLVGLIKTLGFLHVEPDCPPGQWLHNKGYFCVHCPPGSYKEGLRGACIRCPLGAYQPQTGQMACIPCGPHKTTLREGTIDSTSCIMKAVCPRGSFSTKEDQCVKCPPKTYQPQLGQTSCIPCTTGPASQEGQTTCEKETGPGKPYSLMIFSLSSSSIKTMWWKPRSGDVSHYELEYGYPGKSVLATIRIYPSNQPSGVSQYIIRGLEKYTVYKLKVYAVLDNERGKPATYDFRTQEDVPDASPQITSAVALNSSSVEVKWKELPLHARNGIILRYTVYCKASGYAAFDDKKAGRKELSTILTDLKGNTRYCIKMTASTNKGTFPYWQDNRCYWVKTKLKINM